MAEILVFGSGRVGTLAAALLSSSGDYQVHLADMNAPQRKLDLGQYSDRLITTQLDVTNIQQVKNYIDENNIKVLVSALPYFLTKNVAEIAQACGTHYFDLTEDVETTSYVEVIAKKTNKIFAPQCGLAPGFISVVTQDLIKQFDQVETAKMRVGALPINISSPLQYALTWSTEGLVNEYVKPCLAIENYKTMTLAPLEDLETIKIDGLSYEAFNTSGGVGSLKDGYHGKVKNLNYKSIRYPGHCQKLNFLIHDLKLKDKQELLCDIFEAVMPQVKDDVVIVYVSIEGYIDGVFTERHFVEKYYSKTAFGASWTALQMTTACGLCVTIDLALQENYFPGGFVQQEQIVLSDMVNNRFGGYYRHSKEKQYA